MVKKTVSILLVFIAIASMAATAIAAVNGATCPLCHSLLVYSSYSDDSDQQLGVWYESKSHMNHTDYRSVERKTRIQICESCDYVKILNKFYVYGQWFCDPDRPFD